MPAPPPSASTPPPPAPRSSSEAFHRAYDAALAEVRAQAGKSYPLYIGGQPVEVPGAEPITDVSPIDTGFILGRFACAGAAQVDQAVRSAHAAQKGWAALPWRERVRILRRAAEIIRERKFLLSAIMSYEVGKNRFEAMGDTEESANLIDYYCQQVEDHNGFTREMAKMTPIERNTETLRPYGVFACIAPFNFPLALSTGMSSAALMSGNTVVYKPAEDTPWTGLKLYEVYRDAGVPAGAFNIVTGHGREMGDAMWQHPLTAGVVFTGSKPVGMKIFHGLSERWVMPCLMEIGGKNATIVMDTADVDAAGLGGDDLHRFAVLPDVRHPARHLRGLALELIQFTLVTVSLSILEQLMRRQGRVVSKSDIETHLYGFDDDIASNSVEVHMHRLRRRLSGAGADVAITTLRGVGYLLDVA